MVKCTYVGVSRRYCAAAIPRKVLPTAQVCMLFWKMGRIAFSHAVQSCGFIYVVLSQRLFNIVL